MSQEELRKAMSEALGPHFKNVLPVNGPINYQMILEIVEMLVSSIDLLKGHIDMLKATGQIKDKRGGGEVMGIQRFETQCGGLDFGYEPYDGIDIGRQLVCMSEDVAVLESQLEAMKCCGNCHWGSIEILKDVPCNPQKYGRGTCDDWESPR